MRNEGCGKKIIEMVIGTIYCGDVYGGILHLCSQCKEETKQ